MSNYDTWKEARAAVAGYEVGGPILAALLALLRALCGLTTRKTRNTKTNLPQLIMSDSDAIDGPTFEGYESQSEKHEAQKLPLNIVGAERFLEEVLRRENSVLVEEDAPELARVLQPEGSNL